MDRILKIHNLIWLIYFILYLFSPLDYKINLFTYFIIIINLIIGNIAFTIGRRFNFHKPTIFDIQIINKLNINKIYWFFLVCSITYLVLFYIKSASNFSDYGLDISFSNATLLRQQTHTNYTMGNNIYGILSNFFIGFPILLMIFYYNFKVQLSKNRVRLIVVVLLIYCYSLLLSGGRNGIFLLFIITYLMSYSYKLLKIGYNFSLFSKNQKKYFVFLAFLAFFLFSKMAIDRIDSRGVDSTVAFNEYINFFELNSKVQLKEYSKELLYSENYQIYYFPIFQFHDYFIHSLFEFDVTLSNMPANGPYYGQYNFSAYFLLLGKLGFNTTTISSILNELVNPGRYFTLFGALFLDFGFLGMFISIIIIYFLTGYAFKNYCHNQKFVSLVWFLYFYSIIILSPIYSVIGNSIYPGFLTAIITISIFLKFSFFHNNSIIR